MSEHPPALGWEPATEHVRQGTELLARLAETGGRLLLIKDGSVLFTGHEPGIGSLLEAIHRLTAAELRAAHAADAVVGKAGALLLAYAEVGFVAGWMMSSSGAETLRAHGIAFHARTMVPTIRGKNADPRCPFERAVENVTDPYRAVRILTELSRAPASRAPQPRAQ